MGVDQSFYVGPMVKCEQYETSVTIETIVCPNGCRTIDGKYCRDCGSERITIKTIKKDYEPAGEDIDELINEKLITTMIDDIDYVYWVPNIKWAGDISVHLGKYETMVPFEFDGMMIENTLLAFKKAFSKELEILNEQYHGQIKVIWAAASWCY